MPYSVTTPMQWWECKNSIQFYLSLATYARYKVALELSKPYNCHWGPEMAFPASLLDHLPSVLYRY